MSAKRGISLAQWLDQFDANEDGRIERSELPSHLRGQFDRFDLDRDGFITRDELKDPDAIKDPDAPKNPGVPK